MRTKISMLLVLSLLVLPHYAWGELSYIGSSTIGTGILNAGAVEAFQKKTGKRFSCVEIPGTGEGIKALLQGRGTLAGASRALKPEEEKKGLVSFVIGHDAIAVFVHATNPVRNLSREQLKGIFTGNITSWKDVGGKPVRISPTTEILLRERATSWIFQKTIMEGERYGAIRQVDLSRDQLLQLAKNPDGICVASVGLLESLPPETRARIRSISINGVRPSKENIRAGSYPISRPLLLVTKGRPKGEDKRFIDFILSQEGQKIVARNFISRNLK